MYAQHNERQIRRRLKANRFEMNGVPMEVNRKVLLQMYKKRKNNGTLVPTDDEYTATSTVIGHPIYVYIESPKGLVLKQHMQPERQEITGSPIVLTQDEKGRFTLDAKRTQHWSLYGAVAAAISTTADQLYGDVKKTTMVAIRENPEPYRPWFITHLETSPRINYTKNVISTYLRQYKNTFLATVNQVEMQALANVLQRAITVDTPTGVVRAVPTGNATEPPLEIQIQDGHYVVTNANHHILIACSADHPEFYSYRRTKDRLRENLKKIGVHGTPTIDYVNHRTPSSASSQRHYIKATLNSYLNSVKGQKKYDIIALMGCNLPQWIVNTQDKVRRIREHLSPTGFLLIYEGIPQKRNGPHILTNWRKRITNANHLHQNMIKNQTNALDLLNQQFEEIQPGVWKPRQDIKKTVVNTPRSTPSDQLDKIDSLIAMFDRVTTHNTTTHASDPDEDETSVPDTEDLLKRYATLHDIDFDGLELDEAKVRAEELIDDMPQHIDTIQREYEKYIRSQMETPRIPNAYRLDTTGRKTPSSNVSRNVDFTGLSPEEARFIRDFEKELDPTHAESIQRQFDAYMAQYHEYQGPNREAETASSISERLEDLRNAAANVHTPQEARRLDTEIHNATSDVVQYIETHHPNAMSPKVARQPSHGTGDALGVGALVLGGLSLVSSYASVWRVFFSG